MTTYNRDASTPSERQRTRLNRLTTVLLAALFVVAFLIYLATTFVTDTLLDPQLYTDALEGNDIYNRIYTELLADPALEARARRPGLRHLPSPCSPRPPAGDSAHGDGRVRVHAPSPQPPSRDGRTAIKIKKC